MFSKVRRFVLQFLNILLGARGAGTDRRTNGMDAMRAKVVVLVVRSRWPCWSPPRAMGTDAALQIGRLLFVGVLENGSFSERCTPNGTFWESSQEKTCISHMLV